MSTPTTERPAIRRAAPYRLSALSAATALSPEDYATIIGMIAGETLADVPAGGKEILVPYGVGNLVPGGFVGVSAFDPALTCEIRRIHTVTETPDGQRITIEEKPGSGLNPFRFAHPKGSVVFGLTAGVANVLYWCANPRDIADDSRAKLQAAYDDASGSGGSYGVVHHPFGRYGVSGPVYPETYQKWTGTGPQSSEIVANLDFIVPEGEEWAIVTGRRRAGGVTWIGSREGAPTMRFSVENLGFNGGHMPRVSGAYLGLQQQSAWHNWTIRNCPESGLWLCGQQCHFSNSQVLFCGDAFYFANFLLGSFDGVNTEGSKRSDFVFDSLPGGQWSSQISIKHWHQEGHPDPYPPGHPGYVAGRKFAPPRVRMIAGFGISFSGDCLVKGGEDRVIISQENPMGAFYTIQNMTIDYATPSTIAIRDIYGGDDLYATRDFGNYIRDFRQEVETDSPAAPIGRMIRGKANRYIKESINSAGNPFLDINAGNGKGYRIKTDVETGYHAVTTDGRPLHTESKTGGALIQREGGNTSAALHIRNGKGDHKGTTKGTAAIVENDELGIGAEIANTNPDNEQPAVVYSVPLDSKARHVAIYRGAAITQQDQQGRQLYSVSPKGDVWFSRVAADGKAHDVATVTSGFTDAQKRSTFLTLSVFTPDGNALPVVRMEARDGVTYFGVHGKCAPQAPALPVRTGKQTISREASRIDAIEAALVAAGLMKERGK